jgi:MFS family permease
MFAVGTAAAAYLPLAATVVLLTLSGAAWIGTLSSLNAAVQLSLATWVRARGLALYLLVFMGAQGIGAFVWGKIADAWNYQGALAVSAGLLLLTAASVPVLPLLPGTGTYDRTPALDWATPTLVFDPEPADGPVLVQATYQVPPENAAAFIEAMRAVERSRRRTGASRWRLYRDGAEPTRFIELFIVPSWGEHLRQHGERWTGADRDWRSAALALTDGTPPQVRHLFPPGLVTDHTPPASPDTSNQAASPPS